MPGQAGRINVIVPPAEPTSVTVAGAPLLADFSGR